MIDRRDFLKLSAAAMLIKPAWMCAQATTTSTPGADQFDRYFLPLLNGFLENAKKTSSSFAVCDYPDGTKSKTCCAPNGKTYVSVARMLPAMCEWSRAGREPRVEDVLVSVFTNAFDPQHPDYWGEPPKGKATQRSVEAALVGMALHRLGDEFIEKLSSQQRTNINNWLASCTVVPERESNHAWFTAINQAVRLRLSEKFKEFSGDEKWMQADLEALDGLYKENNDGWYSDSPTLPVFDYYNFWAFANFPLYWSRIIGEKYPKANERFRSRVKMFLEKTPYFFASDGAHPLFGRSLIYRWALLAPLVSGYEAGLWPHSPGLLRKIVRKSLEYHWNIGAFDESRGKLRETYSADGTPDVKENYVDNGHPYWAMQAFTFLSWPKDDPFWTAAEEPLPVEKEDFSVNFNGPRMLLLGTKSSGQVRWIQARAGLRREYYRDKYIKFSYSSAFPFNVMQVKGRCPWDQTLVFRDRVTGECVGRSSVLRGEIVEHGVQTTWVAELGKLAFEVTTRLRVFGEFEERTHAITAPAGAIERIDCIDGSYALGIGVDEKIEPQHSDRWHSLSSPKTGKLVSWPMAGFDQITIAETFDDEKNAKVNIVHPRIAVISLVGGISSKRFDLASLHYASPKPMAQDEIIKRGNELIEAWKKE